MATGGLIDAARTRFIRIADEQCKTWPRADRWAATVEFDPKLDPAIVFMLKVYHRNGECRFTASKVHIEEFERAKRDIVGEKIRYILERTAYQFA